MIKIAALFIGMFLACLGILGVASPETFLEAVRFFQAPPVIYLAAIIRVVIGIILIVAARESRFRMIIRVLGILIMIGGLLTPFWGAQLASAILNSWTEGGSSIVRLWAVFSLALGVFVVYAIAAKRRTTGVSRSHPMIWYIIYIR